MKKESFLITIILVLLISIILFDGCKTENIEKVYLKKVLSNLEQIKSATYYIKSEGWAPGDTAAYVIHHSFMNEYDNPADTSIGASFIHLQVEDTNQMSFCYDGRMRAIVYEDQKKIVIDSFNVSILPFRPVNSPFFNNAKNIIKYALETTDSILVYCEDLGDVIHFKLEVFDDDQVEFFGKPYHIKNPFGFGQEISRYDIWINKLTNLPYKIRREMSHDISVNTCNDVEFNKINIKDFKAKDYFQPNFSIQAYRMGKRISKSNFEGKPAPNWILSDAENNTFELIKLKSKVILLEFTSVSCGPCRMSIPFLKELVTEYDKTEFDFVSIEAFAKNSNVLNKYQERNDFNYKFLMSKEEVTKNYGVQAVPVFFILDENRIIQKVISGYGKGTTDKEIRDAINDLLN